jgi:hypothetical protein
VDPLDLPAFHARYGDGPRNQAFHAAMPVKELLLGYATRHVLRVHDYEKAA